MSYSIWILTLYISFFFCFVFILYLCVFNSYLFVIIIFNYISRWGQIFILDCLATYNPHDNKEAQRQNIFGFSIDWVEPYFNEQLTDQYLLLQLQQIYKIQKWFVYVPYLLQSTIFHCLVFSVCERVTPRLSHANAAVVLSAVKVLIPCLKITGSFKKNFIDIVQGTDFFPNFAKIIGLCCKCCLDFVGVEQ